MSKCGSCSCNTHRATRARGVCSLLAVVDDIGTLAANPEEPDQFRKNLSHLCTMEKQGHLDRAVKVPHVVYEACSHPVHKDIQFVHYGWRSVRYPLVSVTK